MTRRARVTLVLAAGLLAVLPACGRKTVAPVVVTTPPAVVSVQPPARTLSYLYDGGIWAVFDRALDPRSVDTTTVFLKQDTQRIPITVRWDAGSKRVVIAPRVTLGLQKAYTVVLSTRLHAADGTPLAAEYSWQFVTNTVRRVRYDFPLPDTLRSSVVLLQWSSPDAVAGVLTYELYAGPDSAGVASRTVPWVYRGTATTYVPRSEWPAGTRIYWAITSVQGSTGERLASPLMHFDTTPADAPTQSVTVPMSDWGGLRFGTRTQLCNSSQLSVGPAYVAGLHFFLAGYSFGARVKSARVTMTRVASAVPAGSLWLSPATGTWTACATSYPGPPFADVSLTLAPTTENGVDLAFESAGLAAYVEATRRLPVNNGFSLGSTSGDHLIEVNTFGVPKPLLTVTYYIP